MVTMTPTRTPHALQSGIGPGALWITRSALGVARGAILLLLLPHAGRHLLWVNGVLAPDATFTLGVSIALAVMVAITLARWAIRRFLDMHIPGRLLNDGPPTLVAPSLAAAAIGNIVLGSAALYAAMNSSGDYGLTKMTLAVSGMCVLATLPGRLLFIWGRGRPGWRGDMIVVATDMTMGGAILLIASASAQSGILHSALVEEFGIGLIVTTTALISLIIGVMAVGVRKSHRADRESVDPLRTLSGRVVDTTVASPTLVHYRTAHRLAMTTTLVGVVLIAAFSVGTNVLLS